MKKYLLAGAFVCSALYSTAQYSEAELDSIANAVELQEVEIKSNSRISHAGRNVILPPRSAVEASVNGRDLIGRLHIPRISVNPLTGEIGMAGNGNVAITINGVMSGATELAAISPVDIVRIEHIDSPGPRYPDVDVLLNVVTRPHASGGSISADLMNAFKKGGEADIDNLAFSFANGKSQWAYSGQLMRIMRDNWARDYSETRFYPTQIVDISEIGKPSKMEIANLDNYLSYSLADDGRYFFNAKLGVLFSDIPHSEEADRSTFRTASDSEGATEIYEHMGESSCSPSLDLYGQVKLGNGANLIGNVVGTYIHSKNDHLHRQYSESGDLIDGFSSHIRGRKYSLISEVVYAQQFDVHRVSGGVRHFQSYADNDYTGDVVSKVAVHQAQTSVYGQYSVEVGGVGLMASLGAARFYNSQDCRSQSSWIFTPSIAASWTPFNGLSLRYKAALQGRMPSLAELSDVAQMIDPGYLRRGNPELRSFRVLDHEFSAGWEWSWLGVYLSVPMSHEFKPVMESVVWDGSSFVRTYFNQKSFSHIGAEATVTVRPWRDYFVLSLAPTIDYYRARGDDFCCSHTLRNFRIDAEVNWRSWQLSYNTMTGYANYMYGTRLMRERNMSMISAGYKSDKYLLKVGVLDPFIKRYWMETRDMSPMLSSVSKAYSDRPTYFVAQVSVNLNFGRATTHHELDLENSDTDSGLLKGVK